MKLIETDSFSTVENVVTHTLHLSIMGFRVGILR